MKFPEDLCWRRLGKCVTSSCAVSQRAACISGSFVGEEVGEQEWQRACVKA